MAGPAPSLRVSTLVSGSVATLRIEGELDVATAGELAEQLRELWRHEPPPTRLRIEAADLTFCDVAGLTPLLDARRRLGGPGTVQLLNPSRGLLRLLRLLDLTQDFGLDS